MEIQLFRSHDIRFRRSLVSQAMLEQLATSLALYYRQVVQVSSVILARDGRLGGQAFQQALLCACTQAGLDVHLEPNPIGTCQFYYHCLTRKESGGLMITASHNPGEYLGLKLVGRNLEMITMGGGPEGGLEKIRSLFGENRSITRAGKVGQVYVADTLASYIAYSTNLAGIGEGELQGLSIVCDFLHGSFGSAVTRALQCSGVEVTSLHLLSDGTFPAGDPNPGMPDSLSDARAYLEKHPVPLLLAYDGDGDRMDVIFEGRQLPPSFVMLIISTYLLSLEDPASNPLILFDVKASPVVLAAMAQQKKKYGIVQNGHAIIKRIMQENGYLSAVEESAHYFYQFPCSIADAASKRYATENTLFFTLLLLKAYAHDPLRFKAMRMLQDSFFRVREWSVQIKETGRMQSLLRSVSACMQGLGAQRVTETEEGRTLGATLYRKGLGRGDTPLQGPWFQVFERLSESEDNLLRYEILASDEQLGLSIQDLLTSQISEFSQTT
ncbi:MAG: hypothetical protein GX315_05665 [Spirochaetales bacterium]|nr:hypothetical protein [Spirochaetales bacterium]